MTHPPDHDTLAYLLDDLDAESRAAFERRLATDPAAARALQEARDALAGFAMAAAPAEAMTVADQRRVLDAVMAAVETEPRRARVMPILIRWAWPLAACLLLALNLWQYARPPGAGAAGIPSSAVEPIALNREPEVDARGIGTAAGVDAGEVVAHGPDAVSQLAAEGEVTVSVAELRRLRQFQTDHGRLAQDNDRLRAEHTELLHQLATYIITERSVNRLAAMELVDGASFAAGERKGLLDFALDLLTEPGVISLDPVRPGVVGAGGDDPSIGGDDAGVSNDVPDTGGSGGNAPPDQPALAAQDPYAWSVYDEARQQGFLNLYNLPTPAEGQSLQLWVRYAADETFRRIGEVPSEYHGGSGSLSFRTPGANQPPAEILITTEPGDALPVQPTGPTVLRGP